ncbi:MAG: ribosomal protein S12 methylthiotransferase RimO [Bacteroides sp. SM23_62_1]|nr:MAG: ribosomal protein S12 methylthiotransferase RimO [Bacteroides sp. SM23_62_1]
MISRKHNKINIITLGCAKNLVDSEVLVRQLNVSGFEVLHNADPVESGTVIINTCGFIKEAKEESLDTIMQYVNARKSNLIDNLYVIGCLSERYMHELKVEIPEVDRYFGVNDLPKILKELGGRYLEELTGERILSTPPHYAYMKVSEGCDRKCSFCAIPLIRGKQKSKSLEKLHAEAQYLSSLGVKELILIAQDLTAYGTDLYGEQKLVRLLENLVAVNGISWIRLHYAYPAGFPEGLTEMIRDNPVICNYLDIPFQHISDKVLEKMHRGINRAEILFLIDRIRKTVPDISIRTTLLTGHPGEGENEFSELIQFIQDQKFERLGVFKYSEEEGTFAAKYFKDAIPTRVKEERFKNIMEIQKDLSLKANDAKVGRKIQVLIDRWEGDYAVGRTEADSPEIDNEVLVLDRNKKFKAGEFFKVQITDAREYDLFGEIV